MNQTKHAMEDMLLYMRPWAFSFSPFVETGCAAFMQPCAGKRNNRITAIRLLRLQTQILRGPASRPPPGSFRFEASTKMGTAFSWRWIFHQVPAPPNQNKHRKYAGSGPPKHLWVGARAPPFARAPPSDKAPLHISSLPEPQEPEESVEVGAGSHFPTWEVRAFD